MAHTHDTARKRTEDQKKRDRSIIARGVLQGLSYAAITDEVNAAADDQGYQLSRQQIAYDAKNMLVEWQEERKEFVDQLVERELRKLDLIESECWAAWEKSKNGKRSTKIEGGQITGGRVGGGKLKERSQEDTFGDVRYLEMVFKCIEKRADILGFNAPKKIEANVQMGIGNAYSYMTEEEIEIEIKRLYSADVGSPVPTSPDNIENALKAKFGTNNSGIDPVEEVDENE